MSRPLTNPPRRHALLLSSVALCALPAAAAAAPAFKLEVHNRQGGAALKTVTASDTLEAAPDVPLAFKVAPLSGARIDRVTFNVAAGSTADCRLHSGSTSRTDSTAPFTAWPGQGTDCVWQVTARDDSSGETKRLSLRIKRVVPTFDAERVDLVRGATGSSHLKLGPMGTRGDHGVRVFCTVSHFAYDDPIVHPGRPGAAHLHMFAGNKSTDANSTRASLKSANAATCDGGTSLESAYWMPALFDAQDRAVVPFRFLVYYKTFIPTGTPNRLPRGTVKPIPDGLEMLAGPTALNFDLRPEHFVHAKPDNGRVRLTLQFPQCVAVHPDGRPVLSHRDMPGAASGRVNSHMAYHARATGTPTGCPASHPYRIPGLFINAWYDVDPASRWYLASDTDRSRPGHSLHADYIAAWDQADMARVVQCNEEGRSCGFSTGVAGLPARLFNEGGEQVYLNAAVYMHGRSNTPWGKTLTPMLPGGAMSGH